LNKILRRVICESPNHSASYDFPPGRIELRREIARRSLAFGGEFNPNDIVVTSGGIEAIVLCLRAVARPGQVVAIEIPTYYGVLAAIQSLGLKVLEIPTHHNEGIDLGELERSLRKHKVAALLTMPNCNSPLGHIMNESNKQRLVDLCERHHVPVIENDVFRDLRSRTIAPATYFCVLHFRRHWAPASASDGCTPENTGTQ
jgi:DNA-binding transcriptional MocR family regulator